MATGRVDVPRRGEFYGHSKKHYRNGTLDGKSSRVHDHGINHLNGYHVSPSERDLAIQHKKEYHVPSNGLQSRPLRVEAAKEDDVQMPPEKKRKFSPIIWDVEDHRSRISSRNRIAPVATALSPPRSVVVVSNVVSDRATEYSATENQVNGLEFSSVKPQVVEPLEIVFPLVDHEHNVDNDREEGQLEEEEVQAPNIATSRWASDSDSPRHMSLSGDEDRPRNGRWVRRSLTPESGECQREDSEGHRSKLSGSGGKCYANGDESENEFESENFIDVDQDSGESSVLDLLELDAEEPTVVTQGGMNMLQSSRSVFEYEKLNKISEGTYGVVYRARDKMTGEIVALKKVKMNVGREDEYGFPLTSLREVNILLSFNHPSIVNVKEVVVDNVDNVFMVMEHVEHDLKGLMSRMKQPFSTSEVKCLMLQLLEGVSYLHNNWVIHRDLKPSNLLLNNKGELKLCDFGMSRQYGSPCKSYTQLVVTQWYRAPELLLGAKQYSTAIDMWSVGCIMAELLLKEPLFQGKGGSDIDQLHKIFAILGTPNEMIWPAFSGLTRAKVNFVQNRNQEEESLRGRIAMGTTGGGSDVEAGFAKLQGEDFEYYMQTYSIMLGRNSKKSTVDVDLSSLGGGMNISRHHARIFYDFTRRRFALEVLGKNGCLVEGVLHLPGNSPVKLDSQDLLQIGDKEFYFLLPVRSILGGPLGPRHYVSGHPGPGALVPHYGYHSGPEVGRVVGPVAVGSAAGPGKKGGRGREFYEEEYEDEDDVGSSGKKLRREGYEGYAGYSGGGSATAPGSGEKKGERSRVDRESDNQQLLQLEEKDVVSSVATVLSDLCGPGEWMPMEKLHTELVEQYSNVWHHSRVRRYLTSEDWPGPEAKGKPWYGLLMLLRKYPEHFVINTRSKGRVTLEFVSLVSLIS